MVAGIKISNLTILVDLEESDLKKRKIESGIAEEVILRLNQEFQEKGVMVRIMTEEVDRQDVELWDDVGEDIKIN